MLAAMSQTSASDVIRVLKRVRQFRDFRPDPVPDDLLHEILDVARWTGSGNNRQPWQFVVIRSPGTRRQLSEIGAPQLRALRTAPLAVAIAIEGDAGQIIRAYDEGRVAERVFIAAQALGLGAGIGWVRADVRPQIQDLLGVSEPNFVRTIVSIGYPSEVALQPKSAPGTARKSLDDLVHEEQLR